MKKRIFNNRGMTYIELMVALSLLTLIIISFTPMLLSSYEALYQAGEDVEAVYDSQKEIEEGLASRFSTNTNKIGVTLRVNATSFFETIQVKGKKVVSSVQTALETVFGGSRARIDIVSGNVVYDDSQYQPIILQTSGLEYDTVSLKPGEAPKHGVITIEAIIPDKYSGTGGASHDDTVYGTGSKKALFTPYDDTSKTIQTLKISEKDDNGRIKFQICGPTGYSIDFTRSPIKIRVRYVDNRDKEREVFTYLYIKPATILLAGDTTNNDYYTSGGVFREDNSTTDALGNPVQGNVFTFDVEGRKMRIDNSPVIKAVGTPSSSKTKINVVKWIDNDETPGIEPYYILAGSDGHIYRMYNYRSADVTAEPYTNTAPLEKIYDALDGTKIYPSLWSGDKTHIFEYSTAWRFLAYGQTYDSRWTDLLDTFSKKSDRMDHCWITSDDTAAKGDPKYNIFSPQAQFCYYSNPSAAPYAYTLKKMRPISYVITEKGFPIRLFGVMESVDKNQNGSTDRDGTVHDENGKVLPYGTPGYGKFTEYDGFYETWDKSTDNYFFEDATSDYNHWYNNPNRVLAFVYGKKIPGTQNKCVMGPIRILSLASYQYKFPSDKTAKEMTNYLTDACDDYSDVVNKDHTVKYMAKIKDVRKKISDEGYHVFGNNFYPVKDFIGGESTHVNISDVIYIPSSSNGDGMTFYVGNVHGFARLQQTDRINTNVGVGDITSAITSDKSRKKFWTDHNYDDGGGKAYRHSVFHDGGDLIFAEYDRTVYPCGALTDFLVMSNEECDGTYVSRFSCSVSQKDGSVSKDGEGWRGTEIAKDSIETAYKNNITDMKKSVGSRMTASNRDQRNSFFFPNRTSGNADAWKTIFLDDVAFTFGFASNRERAYSDITYHGTNADDGVEYNRSYERLYLLSHYGQYEVQPNRATAKATYGDNISDVTSVVDGSQKYLNQYNNDYYNVWLPGEMYNLTKTATKEGVTVAVGYAVAGSSYQYVHDDPTWDYGITSTALGGIYNDGVLSAMIEGQDASFTNLLYFKDNPTFDGSSLTNKTQYAQYKNTGKGYGMHTRKSVQFTAVDILVENLSPTASAADADKVTGTLNYYAFYGDNQGRVFKSLVAKGTGTATGDPELGGTFEKDIKRVSFIADTTYAGTQERLANAGRMEEIKTRDGKSLSAIFSEIKTISASDDMIIITGTPAKGTTAGYVVVGAPKEGSDGYPVTNPDGSYQYEFYKIKILISGTINASTIVEGYYYYAGSLPSGNSKGKGFVAGVSLGALESAAKNNSALPIVTTGRDPTGNCIFAEYIDDAIYSIAGHETE